MNSQELRTLRILEEIEQDQTPSQRAIARKLNISLGLVNSFIKRLAHKGYFKITNIPANRVRYILTPKGAAEKTRLTCAYLKFSFDLYRIARRRLQALFKDLAAEGIQNLVFFGASDLAEIACISLQETSMVMVAVVDDKRASERFLHSTILMPAQLAGLEFDRILITTIEPGVEAMEQILAAGVPRSKVIVLEWK